MNMHAEPKKGNLIEFIRATQAWSIGNKVIPRVVKKGDCALVLSCGPALHLLFDGEVVTTIYKTADRCRVIT